MEEALKQVGLPVKCAFGDCGRRSTVKPKTDYNGWYKSKIFRYVHRKKWWCPDHYQKGREIDNKFYENYKTPDPEPTPENIEAELYKLI